MGNRLNVNKCGVMNIQNRNLEFQYQMNDGWVKSIDEERELKNVNILRLEILKAVSNGQK